MEYPLLFVLNARHVEARARATETLLDVLRERLGVTSPKHGCETGDCGACTVLVNGQPILACITLALTIAGQEVTTVEGLGTAESPHPLQRAFHEHHAAQCGFCTPGMIVSAKALLDSKPNPDRREVADWLGNLCRCGSYVEIIDAVLSVSRGPVGREK